MIRGLALIFGGWALAAFLAAWLGPRTDFRLSALVLSLCVGAGFSVLAAVIA